MTGTGTTPPAVARRRVSLALRRAREAKQWTQTQVANAMEWSLSKVMRIEKGQVNISPSDLRSVLAALDVTDTAEIDELLADARVSRSERYTTDDLDREHLTPAMIRLFQYEVEATSIKQYSDALIPGILQTAEYARAIFSNHWHPYSAETVEARIQSRLRRHSRVFDQPNPPDYAVILDEVVLHRPIGSVAIMANQLRSLARASSDGRVRLRIASFKDSPLLFLGTFELYDLGDGGKVLYRESAWMDSIVESEGEIDLHTRIFGQTWANVLDEDESLRLLESAIAGKFWS